MVQWQVSIPKRVSEALKQDLVSINPLRIKVSIPKRVSEALKLVSADDTMQQSDVSIPKRVSEALKPYKIALTDSRAVHRSFNP